MCLIRETGPACVEDDEPRERSEAAEEPREGRLIPLVLDMREQARDEHEVDGAVADDLVRDVDLATLGVSRLGRHAS